MDPIRTCIGCGAKRVKQKLLRIVRIPGKSLEIDIRQKRLGRGAYLCFEKSCLTKALKKKSLERHLKISVPPDFKTKLEKRLYAGQ